MIAAVRRLPADMRRSRKHRTRAPVSICALLLVCCAAAGQTPPAHGVDAAARTRFVGTHRLSLQRIDRGNLDRAGSVEIRERGVILSVTGSEALDGQRLDIRSHIILATADGFVF